MSHQNNAVNRSNKPSKPSGTNSQQMQEMRDSVKALQIRSERDGKKNDARGRLKSLESFVDARISDWKTAAYHVGSAYQKAYTQHQKILEDVKEKKALNTQILFSILTAVTAGGFSWISVSLSGLGLTISDLAEDVTQAGLSEALSSIGPLKSEQARKLNTVDNKEEPLVYQNKLLIKIESANKELKDNFKDIYDAINASSPESWDKYDWAQQIKQHMEWERKSRDFLGKSDLPQKDGEPDEDMMAKELERAMWAEYVLAQKHGKNAGRFGEGMSIYVGDEIYDYLAQMGVVKKRIDTYLHTDHRLELMERTLKWAKGFKPTPFAAMKRAQVNSGVCKQVVVPPMLKYFGDLRGK